MATTMQANDAVFGGLAECYVTIDGSRYNMMQLYEFESTYEVNLVDVPILGRVTKGTKPAGGSGTWSGTAHYNQSVFRKWMLHYKNTGEMAPFTIQVTNSDPSSQAGRQTIILTGCLIDSLILAKYNADEELLDEELSGTFDDWQMPESFAVMQGMQ